MKPFEQVFNPFDHHHLQEYFRSKATGKTPDFGMAAMGWLPANWLEIAEGIIAQAFVELLQRQPDPDEREHSTGEVDISRLMWYDTTEVLKGVNHQDQTELEAAYRHALSAAIKLKTFLVEMSVYMNVKEQRLQ